MNSILFTNLYIGFFIFSFIFVLSYIIFSGIYKREKKYIFITVVFSILLALFIYLSIETRSEYNNVCIKEYGPKLTDFDNTDVFYPIGIECGEYRAWVCRSDKYNKFGNLTGSGELYINHNNNYCE